MEPEEAFMSMTRVSQIKSVDEQKKIEALYSKYLSMKNKFFEQVWREMVLPNMDAESFKLFLGGAGSDLGSDFIPIMLDEVEKYRDFREGKEELDAQREAGELDEGQ